MRVLFIADIHGICDNLNFFEKMIKTQEFTYIVLLGDYFMAENGSKKTSVDKEKVINFINKIKDKLILIKGNNDKLEDFANIDATLYSSYLLNINSIDMLLSHGDNLKQYYDFSNIFIYGHEHRGYIKEDNGKKYVCCGSISLPAENSCESYALLEDNYIKVKTLKNNLIASIKI